MINRTLIAIVGHSTPQALQTAPSRPEVTVTTTSRGMKMILRAVLLAAFLAGLAPWHDAGAAPPLPIKAFYGKWAGNAVAETSGSIYFGLSSRDLDVTIKPLDSGFKIDWTTVIHLGGESDEPKIRRKSKSVEFAATDKANVFKGKASVDPMSGQDYAWARIDYQTLTVYLLTINSDGIFHLQSYARTLNGLGMDLVFTSTRDNYQQRIARGKLTKLEN